MSTRKSALQTIETTAWGGSYYDSFKHASMFDKYKPYNFGVRNAQLFSSKLGSHLLNKKFTYFTVAKGNTYVLPGGTTDYEWMLTADAEVEFRATELLVNEDAQNGKGGLPFKIALNRNYVHEPTILKTESSRLPLIRIIGHPKKRSANSFEYTVKIQSGDATAYIPSSYLKPERKFLDATTSVADELNTKYSFDQFGEMFKLQSWTGQFARKVEFTDKFIRTELACAKEGRKMPKGVSYGVGSKSYNEMGLGVGYVYQQPFKQMNKKKTNGKPDVIYAGVFVSKAEARLLERIERDREMNFEFGQLEKTVDPDTGRPIKVAPGWRQIQKDGHYKSHNGSLTLSDIYEYISEIFITRRTFGDRKILMAVGEGFAEFFHRLIADEASQFQYIDTHFLRSVNSMWHDNALEYGSQFTSIKFPNGYIVQLVWDPIKDDRQIFPEMAPGTNRTLESYCADIFDFGATDQKAVDASRPENMTCVMQGGAEYYFSVANACNFGGHKVDGSNAYSNNKELGIYREMSGALGVWDATRVGRLEFNPYEVAV